MQRTMNVHVHTAAYSFATRSSRVCVCVVAIVFGLATVFVQGQYGSKIGCMSAECTCRSAGRCVVDAWSMRGRCVVDAWSMRGRCVVEWVREVAVSCFTVCSVFLYV